LTTPFVYQDPFPLSADETTYRLLTDKHVSGGIFEGKDVLKVASEGLSLLSEAAFKDVSHLLRPSHLQKLASIFQDGEASRNDRYVALEMLKNAVIAAEGVFPMCQDTGTAVVIGKKGQQVWTEACDEEALSRGVYRAYTENYLRYSQMAPLSMYEEKNTGCNLPAQIDLYATRGKIYSFLFIAKGGGSANKTFLFQETKAVLNPETLAPFMAAKMKTLGTAACPPYHLAFVVGEPRLKQPLRRLSSPRRAILMLYPRVGTSRAGPSGTRSWSRTFSKCPGIWDWAPSSAADTSAWTFASYACRGTGPHARLGSA
jgi:fumarate hydratase, class I